MEKANTNRKLIIAAIMLVITVLATCLLKVDILKNAEGVVRSGGMPLGSFISLGYVAVLVSVALIGAPLGALVGGLGIAIGTLFASIALPGAALYAIPGLVAAVGAAFLAGMLLKRGKSWAKVLCACAFPCIIPVAIMFLFDLVIMGDGILASCAFFLNVLSMVVSAAIATLVIKIIVGKSSSEAQF